MLPYFHSAAYHNYAYYGAFYIHHRKLNLDIHVHRDEIHVTGAGTSWCCRGGHTLPSDGEIGPEFCPHWGNIAKCSNHDEHIATKEEADGRIKADMADHISLCNTHISLCPHNHLGEISHPDSALINIITGHLTDADVNADDAIRQQ